MYQNKGFTLIELLVVVLIIGILAAVALPQYEKAVEKSRAAEGFTMMKSLSTGFEEYVLANNSLPSSFDVLSVLPGNVTESGGCLASRNFKYCLQTGQRLQGWRLNDDTSWGFIWYSSMQDVGVPGKKFYCYVRRNSKADQQNICKSIGGKEKIQSPTDANFDWYVLD